MTAIDLAAPALSISMAAAAGLVGSFAIMRRMVLAADPMSHIALPGIGIALILHRSPLIGALAMLLLGAILIWSIERRSRISTEAVIGVTFSVALAVGSTITSGEELIDALLGSPTALSGWESALGIVAALAVVAFVLLKRNALVIALVSREIAITSNINVARTDLGFLLAFALTIGLGLRYLGVLLMGSLIIIPAAVARRFARSLTAMLTTAVVTAVLSAVVGTYLASLAGRHSGPFIVMIAGGVFFASLLVGRRDGP
ncbi:MAG TPA: metal ABC transporter permease [Steroidobacteraceae bacterium]|nr:metal ABC transporter permease [Steroidobacteraceae bacterium]